MTEQLTQVPSAAEAKNQAVLLLPERTGGEPLPRSGVLFAYETVSPDQDGFDPTKPDTYLLHQTAADDAADRMMEATAGTTWV